MSGARLGKIKAHYQQLGEVSILDEIGEWLDSSKISELHLCPRKYYYRHERHLIPFQQEETTNFANPMTFGHALHAALASYYDGSAFNPSTCPCPTFDGCGFCKGGTIPKILAQFLINYPDDPADQRDPRTRSRGIDILIAYLRKWQRESFRVVGVEIPFAVPFGLFTYIGRIDLLIEEDGKVKPLDHKTTSRFGMMFDQQFKLSHQMTGYMRSTHLITGHEITEADINAIRVTTNITDESFMRLTTNRTPEDFVEWERATRNAFDEISLYRATGFWPKRAPFACAAYNRQCEYYNLCAAGESRREELIERSFAIQPWIPVLGDND